MNVVWLAAKAALKSIFVKVVSEKFFVWAFFWAGDMIVSSTKTPHDDAWLKKVKETYEQG
jgi:hypothetical protein